MRCSQCKNKLLQKAGSSTRLRLDGPIEFDDVTGLCKARCHWCKSQVTIPIELKKADDEPESFTIPAATRPQSTPLIFRKPAKPVA